MSHMDTNTYGSIHNQSRDLFKPTHLTHSIVLLGQHVEIDDADDDAA